MKVKILFFLLGLLATGAAAVYYMRRKLSGKAVAPAVDRVFAIGAPLSVPPVVAAPVTKAPVQEAPLTTIAAAPTEVQVGSQPVAAVRNSNQSFNELLRVAG